MQKKEWAKLDKDASTLEEQKKIILATIVVNFKQEDPKISANMAEFHALASEIYHNHINKMTESRMIANIKWAEVEGIKEAIKEVERDGIKSAMEMKYNNVNGYGC